MLNSSDVNILVVAEFEVSGSDAIYICTSNYNVSFHKFVSTSDWLSANIKTWDFPTKSSDLSHTKLLQNLRLVFMPTESSLIRFFELKAAILETLKK